MTVHRVDGPGGPARPDLTLRAGAAKKKPDAAKPNPRDSIELSREAREVAGLVESAGRLPDVRVEKVQKVREAIQQGTYDADPRAVARAILEFEGGFER